MVTSHRHLKLLLLSMLVVSDAFGQGKAKGRDSMSALQQRAEQGDAQAQYMLGGLYSGSGDKTQALSWFRKAADQGFAAAQAAIGFMYDSGDGVLQDSSE